MDDPKLQQETIPIMIDLPPDLTLEQVRELCPWIPENATFSLNSDTALAKKLRSQTPDDQQIEAEEAKRVSEEQDVHPITKKPITRLTPEFFKKLLKSRPRDYLTEHDLNDSLYLPCLGITKLENMEKFTGLRTLHLQSNVISKIECLENMTALTSLYLHMNMIEKIEGLSTLTQLQTLNLADNLISRIEGLENNHKLSYLSLTNNQIGKDGEEDYLQLADLKSLSTLDLGNNRIPCVKPAQEGEQYPLYQLLAALPKLEVLLLKNNPFWEEVSSSRRLTLSVLQNLTQLDGDVVLPDERRFANAFGRGGVEEIEVERQKMIVEEQQKRQAERDHMDYIKQNKEKLLKEYLEKMEREYQESLNS